MKRSLPPLSALRAFESAARHLSFRSAADELAVTPTAVSHRIRVLETHLRCRLFVRKVRAIELTEQGRMLYAAVSRGFDVIASAVERLHSPKRRSLTLSTTPAFAAKWLVPRLADFHARYPELDLRIHASNDPVDLRAGQADLAIRYGHGYYDGLHSTLLLRDRFAPLASPALTIKGATGLLAQTLIHFDWHRPPPIDLSWAAWARAAGLTGLDTESGIRYSEESHAIQAAVAGQGVALASLVLAADEIRMGLLEVCAAPMLDALSYHLVRPVESLDADAVASAHAWLIDQARASINASQSQDAH